MSRFANILESSTLFHPIPFKDQTLRFCFENEIYKNYMAFNDL